MTSKRLESLIFLCKMYYESNSDGSPDESQKKYIALEVLDAYKSGELQQLLRLLKQTKV